MTLNEFMFRFWIREYIDIWKTISVLHGLLLLKCALQSVTVDDVN